MVKKIALEVTPIRALELLHGLDVELRERDEAPGAWAELAEQVREKVDEALTQAARVDEALEGLRRKRGFRCKLARPEGFLSLAEVGIDRLDLEVDLVELFRSREAEQHAQTLHELLCAVHAAGWYRVRAKVGRERYDGVDEAIEALVEAAAEAGIFLDPERQADVSFDDEDEEEPHGPAPRPASGARASADEPAASGRRARAEAPGAGRAGPAEPAGERPRAAPSDEARGKGEGKKPKGQKARSGGSFGGLPDDERGAAVPGGLGEEEEFFLSYARLPWPCGASEVKVAYRQVARATHPDRNAGDGGAHHRFVLLTRGYEQLVRRLSA